MEGPAGDTTYTASLLWRQAASPEGASEGMSQFLESGHPLHRVDGVPGSATGRTEPGCTGTWDQSVYWGPVGGFGTGDSERREDRERVRKGAMKTNCTKHHGKTRSSSISTTQLKSWSWHA